MSDGTMTEMLRDLGQRRRRLDKERESLKATTKQAVDLARQEGIPMTKIAYHLGVTRMQLYRACR